METSVKEALQVIVDELESIHDDLDKCNSALYSRDCEESKELEAIFQKIRESKEDLEAFINERA